MSHFYYDPDEWETVSESYPCSCGGIQNCDGMCDGVTLLSQRRRTPEQIAAIKAEKLRQYEETILREADAIRALRAIA